MINLDSFRDPLWQFIGVIIALIAIGVAFFIYYLQRQRKTLAFQIITNTPVLTVSEQVEGKLKVLYENTPVNNAQLVIVKLINNGNLPITRNDYERKLSFIFGNKSNVLSSEIIATKPKGLGASLSFELNRIIIEPLLMKHGDHVIIKTVIGNFSGKIEIDARVVGVNNILQIKDSFFKRNVNFFLGMATGLIIPLMGLFAMGIKGSLIAALSLLVFCIAGSMILRFIKYRKLKQPKSIETDAE